MGATLPIVLASSLGTKLKAARAALGVTTREVAAGLAGRRRISPGTISNYEKARSTPNLEVLTALADYYDRPISWFLESGISLENIRYRNLPSRVRVSDRHRFEANAQHWLDAYARLERYLDKPMSRIHPELPARYRSSGKSAAGWLRRRLGAKSGDSVRSVIEILEGYQIRTIELSTDLRIDGMAARFGEESVVVLNPLTANDRCRMNAGHELGHILLGDCKTGSSNESKVAEKQAFEFASHLLLTDEALEEAFRGQSMVRLVQFKERFGISLAGMIYRGEQAGILNSQTARWLWIRFAELGWRTNEPGHVRADRATRFEQLLDSAIGENRLDLASAARIMGVTENHLTSRLKTALGSLESGADQKGAEHPRVIKFPQ